MISTTSPLEILAAFALCFIAGIASTLAFKRHIHNLTKETPRSCPSAA